MTVLQKRMQLLVALGTYMRSDAPDWTEACALASRRNSWFTPESIQLAVTNIARHFLQADALGRWVAGYTLPEVHKTVGIVMAGNIPLVGFHDFLCGVISGHRLQIKLSSKDDVLLPHLISYLRSQDADELDRVQLVERLQGCEAFIATGSDNSARYFEQYFGARPHLVRKSRTSVAVLDGTETTAELDVLAHDVFDYFGLGCRNITQLYLPEGYDFDPLLRQLKGLNSVVQHHKFRNNYDYQLAIYLLNKVPYLSNEDLLLVEHEMPFSAVATLHYQYYTDREALFQTLRADDRIQAVVGHEAIPFGRAQQPALSDYADGVDTMAFLCSL